MSEQDSGGARPEWGAREMSFWIQPCGADGRPINGGNHYANANTVEAAREVARDILARREYFGYRIDSVEIAGAQVELRGCWVPVRKRGSARHHEVITRASLGMAEPGAAGGRVGGPDRKPGAKGT